jgi:hypothetical protein
MAHLFGLHGVSTGSVRWRRMPSWLVPSTRLGRRAVELLAGFGTLFVGMVLVARFGDPVGTGETGFLDRPLLALLGMCAGLAGISSGVTALFAVVFRRERALPVLVAFLIGALLVVFVIGDALGHD